MAKFLLRVAIVVFIGFHAPWYVTVLAGLLCCRLVVNGRDVW